ncbi:hypothetical protein D9611_001534 [Ephemerocybe angulata]|uniref:Reverse transcriptase domain-containing protein n=1 Tax=Ephemerocybe angulata TaxID=980116 RepID=A0A8H5CI92_9AGAR|nr:hypothetical protein D9611_001534 [Tulosesus angulatus]
MSTPSTTNFNTALHFISSVKQKEVNKQREAYYAVTDAAGTDDLAAIAALPASQQKDAYLGYVRKIVGAITSSSLSSIRQDPYTTIAGSRNLSIHNISTWTALAEKDPHFSLDLIKEWADALDLHVRQTRKKMDCAKLFGELMTEWLGSGDSTTTGVYQIAETPEPAVPGSDAVAEEPNAARLRVEKERLAGLFFAPAGETPLDTGALVEYLDGLFASDAAQAQLASLRGFVGTRGAAFQKELVSSSSVTNAIDGLLGGYSLKEGMRETLEAFRANPAVIQEISSVLTIRMANLDAWEWPIEGVLTEFRTYVTGKLRGFTDPDVIDAILLHYIGTCWQMEFKGRFNNVFNSEAWKRKGRFTPRESARLKAQLSQGYRPIELQRRDAQQKHFFMNRLADRPQRVSNYDDFLDRGNSGKSEADPNSPATVKRKLLHIVSTESLLQRTLAGKFTVFQSDLADFGPTLSHAAILAVLEYFGMPPAWLSFVKRFLQAPIRIEENGPAQIRQRGIPIGNPLSAAIGEVLLFIMDFAVNQNVEGLFLYRMHDDLWLWDADRQLVARGWEEMQKCAGLLGMKFNDHKTGCATVGGEEHEGDGLPLSSSSRVHWDLMVFDAVEGRFVIDQNEVDVHAKWEKPWRKPSPCSDG